MSRHRTRPDREVLEAAIRVISRLGPARFTLADVSAESGLAPATLLQRFGSKRGLLLAVAAQACPDVDHCFSQVRARTASPLAALEASLDEMTRFVRTPAEMANSLAFLEMDLTDPDFHRLALRSSKAIVAGYRALLEDAVQAREIVSCDTARLAHAIQALASGSMLEWAIHGEGRLADWLRRDVEMLLAPLRTRRRKAPRAKSVRPRRSRSAQRA